MVLQPSIYYAREQADGRTFMVVRLWDREGQRYLYQAGLVALTDFEHKLATARDRPSTNFAVRWDSFVRVADPAALILEDLAQITVPAITQNAENAAPNLAARALPPA